MDNAEYHAQTDSISASGLKVFARSPLHYWDQFINPEREPIEPTPAMKLGTATHCAILEPGEFDNRYILLPDGIDRRSKEGKELFASITATGKEPLSANDWKRISKMSAAAHAHPVTRVLFSKAHQVEASIFAEIDGIKCRCRPDFMLLPGEWSGAPQGMIMDVKTTADARPDEFGRQVWNLQYHIQAEFYRRVYAARYGCTPAFLFMAIESSSPHVVAYYDAPTDLLAYAGGLIDELLARYAECVATNNWPGYNDGVDQVAIPGWAQKIMNDGDEEIEVSYV